MGEPAPRWFHCTSHTYGAWLHGDERSFRTRHHREHKIGDYKNPPLSEIRDVCRETGAMQEIAQTTTGDASGGISAIHEQSAQYLFRTVYARNVEDPRRSTAS